MGLFWAPLALIAWLPLSYERLHFCPSLKTKPKMRKHLEEIPKIKQWRSPDQVLYLLHILNEQYFKPRNKDVSREPRPEPEGMPGSSGDLEIAVWAFLALVYFFLNLLVFLLALHWAPWNSARLPCVAFCLEVVHFSVQITNSVQSFVENFMQYGLRKSQERTQTYPSPS